MFDPNKYTMTIIDSGAITVIAKLNKFDADSIPDPYDNDSEDSEEHIDEVVPFIEEKQDPSKTGPRPKKLVAVEVWGYEVGRGRGKRVVIPKQVYDLAAIGCSDREIARWYDMEESTLRYNFSDIMAKGREELKHSLRKAMLHNALRNNNAALQIFLAKNLLGMSDIPHDTEANQPLPWTDKDQ